MFTVCPKCALTLAVTTADLRVGQGYVRCGRCSNVFNALLTLSDEAGRPGGAAPGHAPIPPPPAEALPSPAASPLGQAPPPDVESAPELTGHDVTFVVDTEAASGDTGTETQEFRGSGTFETIVLEGEGITQTEEMVTEESVDTQIAEIAQQIAAANDGTAASAAVDFPAVEFTAVDFTAVDFRPDADVVAALAPPEPQPTHGLAWGLGAAGLLLLLALQSVHHWRNDLAVMPALNGPLTRSYAALGLGLTPRWDIGAYEVNQLGAESGTGAAGTINVRLSVMNRAERAQPTPVVRLTLLNRYGKRLAGRDVTPTEYLKSAAGNAFIAAGQRLDGQVAVLDPGPEASSFELDVCLPGPAGSLRCASDQPTTAAAR
jgi:predicted Zn finger-like uncharacterized protein